MNSPEECFWIWSSKNSMCPYVKVCDTAAVSFVSGARGTQCQLCRSVLRLWVWDGRLSQSAPSTPTQSYEYLLRIAWSRTKHPNKDFSIIPYSQTFITCHDDHRLGQVPHIEKGNIRCRSELIANQPSIKLSETLDNNKNKNNNWSYIRWSINQLVKQIKTRGKVRCDLPLDSAVITELGIRAHDPSE